MEQTTWAAVDAYVEGKLVRGDAVLEGALSASRAARLPEIQVSAAQGKFLHLLARSIGARRVLEVGTLAGYSTIWLARALPAGGKVVTLEFEPKHADVARGNFAKAGLSGVIDMRVGRAIDSLPALAKEGAEPFDLAFIDADKESTADYFGWALKLARPGAVIIVDNVVRQGQVADPKCDEPRVRGIQRFVDLVASRPELQATVLQTVGGKGYDGFAVVLAP